MTTRAQAPSVIRRITMPDLRIRLRKALFGISRDEAAFATRGFAPAAVAAAQAHLEAIGGAFIDGYNAQLAGDLASWLDQADPELRGFAVEGAAMACAVLD